MMPIRSVRALFEISIVTCCVLSGIVVASAQHDHSQMMSMPSTQAAATDTCVTNPADTSCKQYVYPMANITVDNKALCSAMPFMTACSVKEKCDQGTAGSKLSRNQDVCDGFRLLATTCVHDKMSGMSGCSNFNKMCAPGSQVEMCTKEKELTFLPTTSELNTQVKSICKEMTMDGCSKCTPSWDMGQTFGNCNLLDVYGQLCTAMPTMGQCKSWKAMCKADPSFYLCPGGSGGDSPSRKAPVMKMYFNSELPFYLLFASWTPTSNGEYAGAWFAIFFLGVVFEGLQVLRQLYDFRAYPRTSNPNGNACCDPPESETKPAARSGSPTTITALNGGMSRRATNWQYLVLADAGRAVLVFVSVCLAYLLMLAAMSFNVGIFFAVAAGIACGTFVFGRFRKQPITALEGNDCCLV